MFCHQANRWHWTPSQSGFKARPPNIWAWHFCLSFMIHNAMMAGSPWNPRMKQDEERQHIRMMKSQKMPQSTLLLFVIAVVEAMSCFYQWLNWKSRKVSEDSQVATIAWQYGTFWARLLIVLHNVQNTSWFGMPKTWASSIKAWQWVY